MGVCPVVVCAPAHLTCVPQTIRVEEHDIAVTVVFVPLGCTLASPDCVSILNSVRLKNDANAFRVPCEGTLHISLDNTHSIFRGKRVFVTVDVRSRPPLFHSIA